MVVRKQILILILLFGIAGYVQSQTISASFTNSPLNVVLERIATDCQVKLAYDNDLISQYTVTVTYTNASPDDAIKEAIAALALSFVEINGVYVLKPDPIKQQQLLAMAAQELPPPPKFRVLGLVKEKLSGESLPYANVVFVGTSNGVAANSDGYFSIITQQADSLLLSVSYIGYLPKEVKISPSSQRNVLVVELEPQTSTVSEVVVAAPRSEVVQTEVEPSRMRLNSNRLTDLPSLTELDIAAPLQLLPGIDGTTETSAGLNIRKSSSDKNLVLYDGFTIYQIDHFFGAFSSLNAKAIKDIQVFKGGFDATYGGRASSVIEITGKSGSMDKPSADVGVDLLAADATVETPLGSKASFIFSGRRSYTDVYRSTLYEDLLAKMRGDLVGQTKTPSFAKEGSNEPIYYFYDLNTKLTLKPTEKDVISFSGYKGHDDLTFQSRLTNRRTDEASNWGSGGVSVRWARQWSKIFYQTLVIGGSNYNLYYNHTDSIMHRRWLTTDTTKKMALIESNVKDGSITLQNMVKLGERNTLDFGFEVNGISTNFIEGSLHQYNSVNYIDTSRQVAGDSRLSSIYLQNTYSFGIVKEIKYGFRSSHYNLSNKNYFEPRVQIALQVHPKLLLKASAGRYYQFINRIVLVTGSDFRSIWAVSDGDKFPVVRSNHLIAGFTWKPFLRTTIDVEAYSKFTDGIVIVQNTYTRSASNVITQKKSFYSLNNLVHGVDVLVKQSFGNYQLWLAYTLSKSTNQSDKINGGERYPAYDDQLHELKLFGIAQVKRWSITSAFIYGSGKPWDDPTFTSSFQLSPTYSKNAQQLPAYKRVDVSVAYNYRLGKVNCRAGVNVFNLLNASNILSKPYELKDDPYAQVLQGNSPLEFTDEKGMGMLTSVFLNFRF